MIICTFDLATASGCCYGRPNATPIATAVRAPITGEDYGLFGSFYWAFFHKILDNLAGQLQDGERILVAYERPILPQPKWDVKLQKMVGQTSLETTRKLHFLGPFLETICALHPAPIDVREAHIASIKKELAGKGNANKAPMVFVARRAGIVLPEGREAEDAADAFGLFVLAVRHWAPEFQQYWDKRLYSAIAGRLM